MRPLLEFSFALRLHSNLDRLPVVLSDEGACGESAMKMMDLSASPCAYVRTVMQVVDVTRLLGDQ